LAEAHHPLVTAFLKGEQELVDLVRATPEPREPIVQAMFGLEDSIMPGPDYAERKRRALEAAGRVSLDGVDPWLAALFLGEWIFPALVSNRAEEADALLRRLKLLIAEEAPAELRAMVLAREGLIAGEGRGDKERRAELTRQSMALFPHDSPAYRYAFLGYAIIQARRGLGAEIDAEIDRLAAGPCSPRDAARLPYARLASRA
jgi:hypothetical protein